MKLFTAVLFLGFIGGIMGLNCFTCTSGSGAATDTSACNDPFNPTTTNANVHKIDCTSLSASFDVCAKAKISSGGSTLVARTCYASAGCPAQNGCASGSYGGATAEICCCTGTDCNGAGSVAVSVVTAVALLFAAMAFTL